MPTCQGKPADTWTGWRSEEKAGWNIWSRVLATNLRAETWHSFLMDHLSSPSTYWILTSFSPQLNWQLWGQDLSLYFRIFHTKELCVENSFKKYWPYWHPQLSWNANIWAFADQCHSQSVKNFSTRPGCWIRTFTPATHSLMASFGERRCKGTQSLRFFGFGVFWLIFKIIVSIFQLQSTYNVTLISGVQHDG